MYGCGANYKWKKFPHDDFWLWANRKSKESVVLVSEYTCPVPDAVVLWKKTLFARQGNNHDPEKRKRYKTEYLFCLNPDRCRKMGLVKS